MHDLPPLGTSGDGALSFLVEMRKPRAFVPSALGPWALGLCGALASSAALAAPETAEALETASNFEAAAAAYEQRAAADPNSPAAPPALHRATLLRLGTGNMDLAQKDAATYETRYGTTRPTESAELTFAVALVLADAGKWPGVRLQLERTRPRWDKAPLDVRLGALVLHARSLQHAGTPSEQPRAQAEFQSVKSAWGDGTAAEASLRNARPSDDDARIMRRMGRTLTAVGEAIFQDAEFKRAQAASALPVPRYTGPASEEKLLEYQHTTMREWSEKKRAMLERTEANYIAVLDLKPVPPPQWVVASASQVGSMWAAMADEYESAAMPPASPSMAALRAKVQPIARAAADEARDRYARPRMVKCAELSAKLQHTSPYADACRAWLSAHDPDHHVPLDELVPKVAAPKPGL